MMTTSGKPSKFNLYLDDDAIFIAKKTSFHAQKKTDAIAQKKPTQVSL